MSFPLPPRNRRRPCDFSLGKEIGEGALATVYTAAEWDTGKPFALKMFDRLLLNREKKDKDVAMEEHCLRRLNHPGIIKLHAAFRDDHYAYLALELCTGGELWFMLKDIGCPERLARHYLCQLTAAVFYMHDAGIVHRDLKAENMLISGDGNTVKLIDFGTAKDLANPHIKGSGTKSFKKVLEEYVGTPNFMAPEVIKNKASDKKSDIWSLGLTFFQVLAGIPPFYGGSQLRVYKKAVKAQLDILPGTSPEASDLILKMVVKEPDARLGVADMKHIQAHSFFKGIDAATAFKRCQPILSLEDICLRSIGKRWSTLGPPAMQLLSARGAELREQARGTLERFEVVRALNTGKGCESDTSSSSDGEGDGEGKP